jgi:hypothetical protein
MSLFRFAARCRLSMLAVIAALALVGPYKPAAAAEFQPLEIVTKSGVRMFSVEIAKTAGCSGSRRIPSHSPSRSFHREARHGLFSKWSQAPPKNTESRRETKWSIRCSRSAKSLNIMGDGRGTRIRT